jgi:hypothetical protein
MRDAKGLVKIEMADIGSVITRPADTYLGIHVGAIQINLASMVMNQLANLFHLFLKNPVGGRVGDHEGCQLIGMFSHSGFEILKIDISLIVAAYADDLHAGHDGAGRVGSMSRLGDQAYVTVLLSFTL